MANRRMISKSISVSEQVNGMSILARLLFTWMIPHADDWGRMAGNARTIRALVIPLVDTTDTDVEDALQEIEGAGLISRYSASRTQLLCFPTWESHQLGLHRRTASKYPEPPVVQDEFQEVPGSSGLREEKGTEQKRTEGKGTRAPARPVGNQRLTALYIDQETAKIGETPTTKGGTVAGILTGLVQTHGEEEVEKRILDFFKSTDPWLVDWSVFIFKKRFNELRDGPLKPKAQGKAGGKTHWIT